MISIGRKPIPVIDLFAGPGGLGEGFMSMVDDHKERFFKIALSIEKDNFAHQTLTLRSFLRQFPVKKLPLEYYQFVQRKISLEQLYKTYPDQAKHATGEAWMFELGTPNSNNLLDRRIKQSLKGEKSFVLIGGPPCQAYSLVGRARRREKIGLNKEDARVYLYREYYRILAVHRPPVFVMENVKGILSSKVENEHIFKQIINDLRDPIKAYKKLQGQEKIYKSGIHYKIYSFIKRPTGFEVDGHPFYNPKDFVIQSEKYGIPQTRHRVILLGIRSDLNIAPDILNPLGRQIPIEDVLDGIPKIRSGLSKKEDDSKGWLNIIKALIKSDLSNEICSDVWAEITHIIKNISLPEKETGSLFIDGITTVKYEPSWYLDENLGGFANHQSRSHIKEDIYRYLYASCFAAIKGKSPKLIDFPPSLMPKHLNFADGKFTDRFRVQEYGQPSKTITSHISKDGHYFIHPDPLQCRSLTVREAARIQTFPDNYFFCGPRTQQFHQVGNAVPPYLAYQISKVVNAIMQQIPTF